MSEATPRAGARVNHVLSECGEKKPCLLRLCGLSGAGRCCRELLGLSSLGLWLSMPTAGPPRNVGYYFLGSFHMLEHSFGWYTMNTSRTIEWGSS